MYSVSDEVRTCVQCVCGEVRTCVQCVCGEVRTCVQCVCDEGWTRVQCVITIIILQEYYYNKISYNITANNTHYILQYIHTITQCLCRREDWCTVCGEGRTQVHHRVSKPTNIAFEFPFMAT